MFFISNSLITYETVINIHNFLFECVIKIEEYCFSKAYSAKNPNPFESFPHKETCLYSISHNIAIFSIVSQHNDSKTVAGQMLLKVTLPRFIISNALVLLH